MKATARTAFVLSVPVPATALDEKTRAYVERLEEMVDEARLPAGDELISEIERFLRERGEEPGHGQVH